MKKTFMFIVSSVLILLLMGCSTTMKNDPTTKSTLDPTTISPTTTLSGTVDYYSPKESVDEDVLKEIESCFKFFWETQNSDVNSNGFGLSPDRYNSETKKVGTLASIASVGYCLSAIPIGVEHGFITKEEGEERALETLKSIQGLERLNGFYYHFYNYRSGIKSSGTELSVIDTAIFVNGALTVGKYFGGDTEMYANAIYKAVDWSWYYDQDANQFYMGFKDGTFSGYWGAYAEQLMIFILAAGSPTHAVGRQAYTLMKGISKKASSTSDYDAFYMTWTGSQFVYQYSHNWFDSEKFVDADGYSWYLNSVNASKAAYAYAQTQVTNYNTFSTSSWGLSACDGPDGYSGAYGNGPSTGDHYNDGTVALYAAVASIPFTEEESLRALKNYMSNTNLVCEYGLIDSYNMGAKNSYVAKPEKEVPSTGWYGIELIGIDKGNELLMLENYYSSLIWNIYMDVEYIQDAMRILGFTTVNE